MLLLLFMASAIMVRVFWFFVSAFMVNMLWLMMVDNLVLMMNRLFVSILVFIETFMVNWLRINAMMVIPVMNGLNVM